MYVGGKSVEIGYGRLNTYAAVQAVIPEITGPDFICWIFHSKVHHYSAAKCTSNSGAKYTTLSGVLRVQSFLSFVFCD